MIRSSMEYSAEIIRARHEHPADPVDRLIQHGHEHSYQTAVAAERIALAIDPHDRALGLVVWSAGLFHDIEHYDEVVPSGIDTELLEVKRTPKSDGAAEQTSADQAREHYMGRMMLRDVCDKIHDAIDFGTRYTFINGKLRHPFIKGSVDPLSAYIVAKADLLNALLRTTHSGRTGDPKTMLDISLRFLLERYPALAEHIIDGKRLPDDTFDALRHVVLPAFAEEEQSFMSDQYRCVALDADGILTRERVLAVEKLFDLSTCLTAHQLKGWEWMRTPTLMTKRLREALPDTLKSA